MDSKLSFLLAFAFLFSTVIAQDSVDNLSEFESLTFESDGKTILYRLLSPTSNDSATKYPLVIFFHGAGERGNDNTKSLKHIAPLFLQEENRSSFPAYVLVPQCPSDKSWTYPNWYDPPQEPMRTVIELIEEYMMDPRIDTTRIYLTGLSMGGGATWYLLTKFPRRFAAAIPICGSGDWNRASAFAHIPVWAFHGRKDDKVPVFHTQQMIKSLHQAGGSPKYTEYKKVKHNSWEYAYKEEGLLQWLFDQRLKVN